MGETQSSPPQGFAGTTGLERAASAVTELREWVLQQLTRPTGFAKRRASHIRQSYESGGCVVGWELEKLP